MTASPSAGGVGTETRGKGRLGGAIARLEPLGEPLGRTISRGHSLSSPLGSAGRWFSAAILSRTVDRRAGGWSRGKQVARPNLWAVTRGGAAPQWMMMERVCSAMEFISYYSARDCELKVSALTDSNVCAWDLRHRWVAEIGPDTISGTGQKQTAIEAAIQHRSDPSRTISTATRTATGSDNRGACRK